MTADSRVMTQHATATSCVWHEAKATEQGHCLRQLIIHVDNDNSQHWIGLVTLQPLLYISSSLTCEAGCTLSTPTVCALCLFPFYSYCGFLFPQELDVSCPIVCLQTNSSTMIACGSDLYEKGSDNFVLQGQIPSSWSNLTSLKHV